MKSHTSRVLTIILILVFTKHIVIAQSNKLKVHGLSFGVGIATSNSQTSDYGSSVNLDFSTIVNKHIISSYFNSGINLNPDGLNERFFEFDLTYGRKWRISKNLFFEGHIGFGIFGYHIDMERLTIFPDLPDTVIGFPIRAKLLYYPLTKFGIGLNQNINFNSIHTAYSSNIIFQYNFN